jgi:hypothetical protein
VEKCTNRLVAGAEAATDVEKAQMRRYVEDTYCSRFAERGWVYDNGTLSIEAFKWLEAGGEEECVEAVAQGKPAKPARTVPCEDFDVVGGRKLIADCAPLLHVRRSDVQEYIEELRRRHGDVACEDGTRLEELGAP